MPFPQGRNKKIALKFTNKIRMKKNIIGNFFVEREEAQLHFLVKKIRAKD